MKRAAPLWARLGIAMCAAAMAVGCEPRTPIKQEATAPLLARDALFGNPSKTQARLSPDGAYVSFLAPEGGYLNIFVAPAADISKARPVTKDRSRGVRKHWWAENSAILLYMQDTQGDENYVIHAVDIATGVDKTITPAKGVQARFYGSTPRDPDMAVIALNDRDAAWHDVYQINVRTGQRALIMKNTQGFADFTVDESNLVRLATKTKASGVTELWSVDGFGDWSKLMDIPFEDTLTTWPIAFAADGDSFLMFSSIGMDKAALVRVEAGTGAKTPLGESPKADVTDVWLDPATNQPEAYAADYLKLEWTALSEEAKADISFLKSSLKGEFQVVSQSADDSKWIVVEDGPTTPTRSYLYDRRAKAISKLFDQRPQLEGKPLQPMIPVEIQAKDGLTLVSYLTLPPGADADGDGRPEKPIPLVLNVHGGPWARDIYMLNPEHQWLANRGYAVLSINYRGSTGFGKAFANAGNREWGGKMQDDLLDAVDWSVREGVTTPEQVAIYGGSYGGYAALAGLAFTPDMFACGVDVVGPSNLETLLSSVPPYWKAFYEEFALRVGDPRTAVGKTLLKERSPFYRARDIRKPLLIAHGANDPRAKRAESDEIVRVMREQKLPVTYVMYPDEGHGFARPQNRMSFYAVSEAFLSHCLGGRYEPVGKDFEGSSIEVLEGAALVPGLAEALPKAPAKPN